MGDELQPHQDTGIPTKNRPAGRTDLSVGDHCESIRINSDGSRLVEVRRFLERVAAGHGFSDEDCYDIKIAVGEACSNAIEHGSPLGENNEVVIRCCYSEESLTVEVVDEGRFHARIPVLDGSLNHRGRGIPFMLALMDEVDIAETANGTIVRLVKHRSTVKQ